LDDPLLERLRRALAPEFEVDRRLAAGGMGIVFCARELALDRHVAIKVLRPELATAVARDRFLREARLLARLQHPNIVPVHRADERDGLSYYVMDFMQGQTLADRLAAGPLPPEQVLRLARDLVEALAAAHAEGIIHRDVKPHNIFFIGHRAVLGDFGIASEAAGDGRELTEEGALIGTRDYMAPEQLRGEPATERSDQYSAAAVLYEAASGRRWKGLEAPATADWTGVPRPMLSLLRRGLAMDPAKRWASMREARQVFDRARFRGPRRWTTVALAAGAVLLGWKGWSTFFPPAQPASHYALAILPFEAIDPADQPLAMDAAVDADIILASYPSLDRAPFLRSSDWRRAHPSEDDAAARRALRVEHLVTGRVERRGDNVRLQLTLTDSTGSRPLRIIQLDRAAASPTALGDSAALLVAVTLRRPGTDLRNLASHNSEAALAFLQGEKYFDEDAWTSAAGEYAKAAALDSTFVLARWRQLVAQLWSRDFSWDSARTLAACCADRLPSLDSGLVRALSDTNLESRFRAFDALQARFGSEGSLPLLLASDLFHRGPLLGRGLPESLDMFEAAITASPGGTPAPAYDHMVWGKTRLGERKEAARWLERRRRLVTDAEGEDIAQFLQLGYDLRWRYWWARVKLWLLERYESDATVARLGQFFRFSASWDLPRGQNAVGAVIASRLLAKDRASGLEAQGLAHLTWGRLGAGLALIDSAAQYFKSDEAELQRRQWRLLLPLLGAGRAGESEEASARLWLGERATDGRFSARAQWTLALDALHQGDTVAAAGWISGLADLGTRDSASARMAILAGAMLAGGRDPRGALAATTPLLRFDSPGPGEDIFTRSLLHLSRASWFEAAGDPDGARREILWYENSDTYRFPVAEAQKMEVDAVASVAVRVTRARLLLDVGETDVACRMLTRVRQLWGKADASLDAARARADSLQREGC
jgi:serine/threonine protein kinase